MKTGLVVLIIGLLVLSSCGRVAVQKEYVKCKIPDLPVMEYEPIPQDAPPDKKLEVILNNCRKLKYERDLLKEVIELCR